MRDRCDSVSFSMGCGKVTIKTPSPPADRGSGTVTPVHVLQSRPVSPQLPTVSSDVAKLLPDVD